MPINAFRFGHMPNSVEKKTPNNLENYSGPNLNDGGDAVSIDQIQQP